MQPIDPEQIFPLVMRAFEEHYPTPEIRAEALRRFVQRCEKKFGPDAPLLYSVWVGSDGKLGVTAKGLRTNEENK